MVTIGFSPRGRGKGVSAHRLCFEGLGCALDFELWRLGLKRAVVHENGFTAFCF